MPVTDDLNISDISYHYDGPHGMNSVVKKIFATILEGIFLRSGMDMSYFRIVTTKSNKYEWYCVKN